MLDYDPVEAVAHVCRRDPALRKVVRRAGPLAIEPSRMQSPFESLLRAIVYQQLSGKAAATIYGRVLEAAGKPRTVRPDHLAPLADERLRACGLSRAKVAAVRDLIGKTDDGTVPPLARLRRMHDDEIVARLTAVRGVGRWTVEMLLIFRLGRPDVFPVDDLGVRKGYMLTYGLPDMPRPRELATLGERWRPYRSVASWYMWRAVDQANKAPAT